MALAGATRTLAFNSAPSDERISTRLSTRRLSAFALGSLLTVAIGCHVALLPLGKWQPDEFMLFYNQRLYGGLALLDRVSGWSPRPFPELLVGAYGGLVHLVDRPLTVPCLAMLWAGLLFALYAAARRTRRQPALVALTLFSAFLLLAKPGETFYWPAAALSYLPCLGALGAVCILTEDPSPRRWLFGLVLITAAWTTEIGATYVLINAGLLLAAWPVAGNRLRPPRLAWTVAAAAAAYVVIITATHRATMPDAPVAPLGTALAAALSPFLQELAELPFSGDQWWYGLAGLAIKLMLFLGFRPAPSEVSPDRGLRLDAVLRGIALLLAGLASIVFAYRQFGMVCCERHVSFRQGLVVLALYSFAQAWPTRQLWPARAALLAVPLAVAFAWRLPDIRFDRSLMRQTIADNAANWRSGLASGSADLEWHNAPIPRIANGWLLDPGTYVRTTETEPGALDWRYFAVLVFFGKHRLHVR